MSEALASTVADILDPAAEWERRPRRGGNGPSSQPDRQRALLIAIAAVLALLVTLKALPHRPAACHGTGEPLRHALSFQD